MTELAGDDSRQKRSTSVPAHRGYAEHLKILVFAKHWNRSGGQHWVQMTQCAVSPVRAHSLNT